MPNIRTLLGQGQPLLGLGLMYPAPGVIERIGPDWDWIWIDGQHGELGLPEIRAMVRTCELVGRPSAVRIPWLEPGIVGQVLDANCDALVVPCVDTVDEARAAVSAAKFPPLGRRSYGGRRVIDRRGRNYSDTANDEVALMVQIESPAAVEAVEEIAALPGVDGLFFGPDDILLRKGHSMSAPRSPALLEKDLRRVAAASRARGKFAVTVAGGPALIQLSCALGYDLIVAAADVTLLAVGSRSASDEARKCLSAMPTSNAAEGARTVY